MEITKETLYKASQAANHQQLRVMYDAMKSERDALAVTVDALRKAVVEPAMDAAIIYSVKVILNKTPQHHLRQVRADAGRDGFIEGVRQEMLDKFGLFYHETRDRVDAYKDSILAGKE